MMRTMMTLAAVVGLLTACGTAEDERAVSGAGIGAATGVVVGGPVGALVGAGAGAATGAVTEEDDVYLGEPVWEDEEAAE